MSVSESQSSPELTMMTEAELAAMRSDEGDSVVNWNGRYWRAMQRGFYQPVNLLARLKAAEVGRPARLCWGYRAALDEESLQAANGSIPVHLWTGVEQFTESVLNRNRRGDLRKCRRNVEIRRLSDPSIIVEQGYAVFMSAMRRVAYWQPRSEIEYRRMIGKRAADERRLFVVGLVDGQLAGYMESYAVDGVLYADELIVATEALRTGINTGLYVETIQIAARAGSVRDVCAGLHTPERPGLCTIKDGLGFGVVQVPARVAIPGPVSAYIRSHRPAVYYRLTGLTPPSSATVEGAEVQLDQPLPGEPGLDSGGLVVRHVVEVDADES